MTNKDILNKWVNLSYDPVRAIANPKWYTPNPCAYLTGYNVPRNSWYSAKCPGNISTQFFSLITPKFIPWQKSTGTAVRSVLGQSWNRSATCRWLSAKTAIYLLLIHWRCCSLALSHQCNLWPLEQIIQCYVLRKDIMKSSHKVSAKL